MNFKKVCQRWNDSANLMLKFQNTYKDKYLLIKYEDLLENPKQKLTEILHHYNLTPETYPFDKIESMPIICSSSASKKGNEISWEPVTSTKTFKPSGKWNNWTMKQKNIFKNIAGDTLIKTNYCDDLDW